MKAEVKFLARLALAGVAAGLLNAAALADPAIRVNQLGYLPGASKLAVVTDSAASEFMVLDAATGATVLRAALGPDRLWDASGEQARIADFSALQAGGRYRLKVAGAPLSAPFSIDATVYRALDSAALKAYYFNRASTALLPQHAGVYARAAGHPDDHVLVHASAATAARPAGTVIAAARGWYDAGDYNKYIVNSGIATYTLLAAYEHYPAYFAVQNNAIPESGNGIPDILNEALWNLQWMLNMQDPQDGGVYHKLTNKKFDGMVMPEQATTARFVVQKTTAAALDFAAVMATASRVLAPFDSRLPGLSATMRSAAVAAWTWAQAHPDVYYQQPADIATGEYPDNNVSDEFAWAAAELFIATGDDGYYLAMRAKDVAATTPDWEDVRGLAWISLAQHRAHLPAIADRALIEARILTLAERLSKAASDSAYAVAMEKKDFVWGSNAVALNQAVMLLQAYRINARADYLRAAQSALDYVLGRNATGSSFVTGFGERSPMHPHHRPSQADKVNAPVPGFMVGGPQPGQQDKAACTRAYPSVLAAKAWLDDVCSYASNEVAINWNAPLVYVAAALSVLTPAPH
jgi:endoglucanase